MKPVSWSAMVGTRAGSCGHANTPATQHRSATSGVRCSHDIFTRAVVGDHPVAHKLQDQDEQPRVEREHPHLLLQSLHLAEGVAHSVFMSYHCRNKHQHIISVVYKHYYILCSVPRLQRQIVTEYRSPHSHQPATGQLLPLRHRRHTAWCSGRSLRKTFVFIVHLHTHYPLKRQLCNGNVGVTVPPFCSAILFSNIRSFMRNTALGLVYK